MTTLYLYKMLAPQAVAPCMVLAKMIVGVDVDTGRVVDIVERLAPFVDPNILKAAPMLHLFPSGVLTPMADANLWPVCTALLKTVADAQTETLTRALGAPGKGVHPVDDSETASFSLTHNSLVLSAVHALVDPATPLGRVMRNLKFEIIDESAFDFAAHVRAATANPDRVANTPPMVLDYVPLLPFTLPVPTNLRKALGPRIAQNEALSIMGPDEGNGWSDGGRRPSGPGGPASSHQGNGMAQHGLVPAPYIATD